MSRQLASVLFLLMFAAAPCITHAQQQQASRQHNTRQRTEKRRMPSLAERLQQFRQDLLGESRPSPKQKSSQHQNQQSMSNRRHGSNMSARKDDSNRQQASQPRSSLMPQRTAVRDTSSEEESASAESGTVEQSPHPAESATNARPATAAGSVLRQSRGPTTLQERLSAANKYEPVKATPPTPEPSERAGEAAESSRRKERAPVSGGFTISPTEDSAKSEAEPAAEATSSDVADTNADEPKTPAARKSKAGETLFSGQSAILSIEASGPRKVLVGKEATFTFRVRNAGEAAANNVAITINVPAYAEVMGAQVTAGTTRAPTGGDNSGTFEWKIARLEARGRQTLTLRLIPRKSAPLDLAAQWTCSPETSQTLVEVQEPKLLMALSGPEEVLYGQTKIYKLTISNPGNGDAENVVVGLVPFGRASDAAASHKLGTLKAGDSKAIEVELTARQAGAITIKAQAFADGGLRADVTEQVLVRRANLRADIEGPKVKYAGTNCTYRVRVANTGNAAAENVQVAALLPPQAKFLSASGGGRADAEQSRINWTAGSLQPGSERVLELQCSLQASGENRLQVLMTGDDDLSATSITSTRVEAIADLKLEVRDPQGPVPVGEETIYEIVVRNRGTKSAEEVELVIFFSEGLEATSVQGGGYEIGRGQVVLRPIRSIGAGGESVFRVHTRADRGGNHVLRAELVCQSLGTKLSAEEATHFYGEEADEDVPGSGVPHVASEPRETQVR